MHAGDRHDGFLGRLRRLVEAHPDVDPSELVARYPELAAEAVAWAAEVARSPATDGWPADEKPPLREPPSERYRRFELIDGGGQGFVFQATDSELRREVAFKVLRVPLDPALMRTGTFRPDALLPPVEDPILRPAYDRACSKFVEEALITGGLSHPGITPVYELGRTSAGIPYYTMKLVRGGGTLEQKLTDVEGEPFERRMPLLEDFLKACDAVAYAHSRNVLHCDLKPSNVAVGRYGEVVVLDWGLSTPKSGGPRSSGEWRDVLADLQAKHAADPEAPAGGTPGYMPPETIGATEAAFTPAGDVYGLGVILFRILTDSLPFSCDDLREYALRATRSDPPTATSLRADVPQALSDLCARALVRERADRTQSVDELAGGIRAWQAQSARDREVDSLLREAEAALADARNMEGEPTLKSLDRALAPLHRIRKLSPGETRAEKKLAEADRLRTAAIQQQRARDRAALKRQAEEAQRLLRRRILTRIAILSAVVAILTSLYVVSQRDEAIEAAGRAEAAEVRTKLHLGQALSTLATEFASEGRHAAAHLAAAKALQTGHSLTAWAALSEAARFSYPTFDVLSSSVDARCFAYDAASSRLYVGCADGFVRMWSLATGELLDEFRGHGSAVTALALSPDGSRLYSGGGLPKGGLVRVWDTRLQKIVETIDGFAGPIHRMWLTDGGSTLLCLDEGQWGAAGSLDVPGGIRLWDLEHKRSLWRLDDVGPTRTAAAAVSRDGAWLFTASGKAVTAWSMERRRPERAFSVSDGSVADLLVSADGASVYLAIETAAATPGRVERWDWRARRLEARTEGVSGGFDSLVYDAERGRILAGRHSGGWVHAWRVTRAGFQVEANQRGAAPLLLVDEGRRLVAANPDNSICLCDAASGALLASLPSGHREAIRLAVGSADGSRLVTADAHSIRIWDTINARPLGVATTFEGARVLATAGDVADAYAVARGAVVWQVGVRTGVPERLFDVGARITALAYSADGKSLDVGTEFGDVLRLSGEPIAAERVGLLPGSVVALSAAGGRLAACVSQEGTSGSRGLVQVWSELVSGSPSPPLWSYDLEFDPAGLAFDGTGASLVAYGSNGVLRSWHWGPMGAEPVTKALSLESASAAAYSLDGRWLYVAGIDVEPTGTARGSSQSAKPVIRVVSRERDQVVSVLEAHTSPICGLLATPGGARLLSVGTEDREILSWRGQEKRARVRQHGLDGEAVLALARAPRSKSVYVGLASLTRDLSRTNAILRLDVASGRAPVVLDSGRNASGCNVVDGRALAIAPDGSKLFSGLWSAEITSFGAPCSIEPPHRVPLEVVGRQPRDPDRGPFFTTAYPLVDVLSVVTYPNQTALGDAAASLYTDRRDEYVLDLVVSADGTRVYAAGRSGTVYEYDVGSLSLLRRFREGTEAASSIALGPGGATDGGDNLFVGSRSGEIRIWNLSDPTRPVRKISAHSAGVGALVYSCGGRCLYSAAGTRGIRDEESRMLLRADTTIKRWNVATGELLQSFRGHRDFVTSLALREPRLFSGSLDGTVRVWDVRTGSELAVLDCGGRRVRSVALSEDGGVLVCGLEAGGLLEFEVGYFLQGDGDRVSRIEADTGLRMDEENLRVVRVLRDHLIERIPATFGAAGEGRHP